MATKRKVGQKGQIIHSQARELVYKVLKFFEEEAEGSVQIPVTNYRERVLKATGISISTYQRICKEARQEADSGSVAGPSFSSPARIQHRIKPKVHSVNEREIALIRQIVNNFYITEKCRPTLKCIYKRITDANIGFTGGISSMRRLLIRMGFRWQKIDNNQATLIESSRIRLLRLKYLRNIMEYRRNGWNIVYTDETYIYSSHTCPQRCIDSTRQDRGLRKTLSKANRLIIVHAGGEGGFIPNGLLIFRSGSSSGDYHDDMNHKNFMKWVQEQLIPNLQPRSVLVVDNASYHNVKEGTKITSSSRKEDMENWLTTHNIPYKEGSLKVELYELIKAHKNNNEKFVLDQLMEAHGHKVLRMPPYHPDLNPMEKIWASVKNWVAKHNTTFKLDDVQNLTEKRFDMLSKANCDQWKNISEHVIKHEKDLMIREGLLDIALDEFAFAVNENSSEESEESDGDSEADSDIDLNAREELEF